MRTESRSCEGVDERARELRQEDDLTEAWTATHGAYPDLAWNIHIRCPEGS